MRSQQSSTPQKPYLSRPETQHLKDFPLLRESLDRMRAKSFFGKCSDRLAAWWRNFDKDSIVEAIRQLKDDITSHPVTQKFIEKFYAFDRRYHVIKIIMLLALVYNLALIIMAVEGLVSTVVNADSAHINQTQSELMWNQTVSEPTFMEKSFNDIQQQDTTIFTESDFAEKEKVQEKFEVEDQKTDMQICFESDFIQYQALIENKQMLLKAQIQKLEELWMSKINELRDQIITNNSIAIYQAKQEIKQAAQKPSQPLSKQRYDSNGYVIQETPKKPTIRQRLVRLKLFPIYTVINGVRMTSHSKLTFSQRLKLLIIPFFNIYYTQWRSLNDMINDAGTWESTGNSLTVATFSKVAKGENSRLGIFVPTIITFEFPWDTPAGQNVQIAGIRLRYDIQRKEETPVFEELLGQLEVKVTLEEMNLKKPVRRVFYCESSICNQAFSLVRIKTNYPITLHYFKIQTIFTARV